MSGDLVSSSNLALAASGLLLLYFSKKYLDGKTHPPYPPGPPGLPVLGNLLDMPRKEFALTYVKWGEQYGPISWAVVPGRKFVILNTYESMYELLNQRGGIYIDRPVGVMSNKLVGSGFTTGRRMGDATWQRHRKFLRQALSPDIVKKQYSDLFTTNASRYLEILLHQPEDFFPGLKRMLGETIAELTYGALRDENGVDYVTKQEEFFAYTKRASMGYLVDLFPLLRFVPAWFPGAQFQRDAKRWRDHCSELRKTMIDGVERRRASKQGHSCYVTNILEDLYRQQTETGVDICDDVQAVHDSALSFFQVGSDTTEVTVKNFMLAMVLFPEVQARAREEVDQFFGEENTPNFASQEDMPYIHAVILESFRWNPPASLGVPHASGQDDVYKGYFIPKGTTIITNQWKLSRDPSIYEDPSTFSPVRFLDNANILDPQDFIFGFGRRICPGSSLAYQMTWAFVVSILWAFELKRPEGGPPLDKDVDRFDFGVISYPYPFTCEFIPRRDLSTKLTSLAP